MATTFDLIYNYDLRRLVQSTADYNTPLLDSELPFIYYGMDSVLVRVTVISKTGAVKNLAGVINKFASIKDSANDSSTALVTSDAINDNGTWTSGANPSFASGQVTALLNTVSAELLDKLNTSRYIDNTRLQIKLRDVDNFLLYTIDIPIKCFKEDSVLDDVTPPTPASGYMLSPTNYVENNIVTFNASGDAKDSGYSFNDAGTGDDDVWSAEKVIAYFATLGGISSGGTSTNNAIVLWDGASGGILKDSAVLLPTGAIVGLTDIQTLTNKTLTSPVINTPTGITKTDVGLANVDNTADSAKSVLSATKLTTARTINGVSFDGTANITINSTDNTKVPLTRTVNNKALSANITLDKTDIGLANVDNTADSTKSVFTASKLATARTINSVSFDGSSNITVYDATKVPITRTVNAKELSSNIVLNKTDIGLGNVDNTADINKSVATASALTNPVQINGVGFDGSANITVYDATKVPITRTVNAKELSSNIVLNKTDIGLGNVDNTADINKSVATASALTNPVQINGVDFDGSEDITITSEDSSKVPLTRTINSKALSADIVLTKADIGLTLVDNTADTTKAVLSASKLTTARTINDVSFDGTGNITIYDSSKVPVTRTINSKALSGNINITKSDVGLSNVDNTADATKAVLSAGKLTTPRTINSVSFDGSANIVITAEDSTKVPLTRTINGQALSGDITLTKTHISLGNVDNTADATKAVLSSTKLATARTINGVSFDGTANITVYDSSKVPLTRTVNSKALSGDISLTKSDIGLGSVDNTADNAKNVLSATKLTNARTINGVSFDGTQNITIAVTGDYVTGASSSVNSTIALFSGTTGKVIKESNKVVPVGNIVGTTDTQTITNKTITAPIVDNYITFTNQPVNPATPNAGTIKVFTKTDGHVYAKNSDGEIIPLDSQISGYPETTTFSSADTGKPIVVGTPSTSNDVQLRNITAVSTFSVDADDALEVVSGTGTSIGQIQIAFMIPSTGLTSLTTKMVLSTNYIAGADLKLIAYDGDYDRTATPPYPNSILDTSASIETGKISELVTIVSAVSASTQTNISVVLSITTPSTYSANDVNVLLSSLEIYDTDDLSIPLFTWTQHTAITSPAGSAPNDYALCGAINSDALAVLGGGIPVYNDFGTLYTAKTTPANNDRIAINNSADSYAMNYISVGSLNYRYTVGASSAVNNNFASFDGTTGKLIKDSGYSASDLANVPTADEKLAMTNASTPNATNPFATSADLADKADLVGGKVPTSQLPGFTDEIKEFADYASLPTTTAVEASVVYDTVTFTADTGGEAGNLIVLVFNGTTDDLDTITGAWNTAHPTNTVAFSGQVGTYTPAAGTATLVGGIDAVATSVIYITLDDNKQFRWGGTVYVELSASLALGETSGSAYRGDRGKAGYDHSIATGNPHSLTLTDLAIPNVTNTKNNYESILDPDADDDNTAGYSVGSIWVNTDTTLSYICTDATTASAVWNVQTSGTMANVGTGAGIYKTKTAEEFKLKSLTSSAGTVSITAGTDEVNLEAVGNNSVIPFIASFTSASVAPFTWNDNVVTVIHGRDNEYNMIALYNETTGELLDYTVETLNSNVIKIYFPVSLVPVADTYKIVCSNVGGNHTSIVQNYEETDESVLLSREKQIYTKNVTTTTTFTFDTSVLNLVTGEACTFEIDMTMATVSTINFPASVVWLYGTPIMNEQKIYRLVFHSIDQGTTWYGNLAFERSIV